MTYILGGSRHIVNLPSEVEDLLGKKLSIDEIFYIGDAPGSDTAFQYFFAKKNYKNVKIVLCIFDSFFKKIKIY